MVSKLCEIPAFLMYNPEDKRITHSLATLVLRIVHGSILVQISILSS